jgi:hypothetical protein
VHKSCKGKDYTIFFGATFGGAIEPFAAALAFLAAVCRCLAAFSQGVSLVENAAQVFVVVGLMMSSPSQRS